MFDTSMAMPQISDVVALIIIHLDWSPSAIKSAIYLDNIGQR
jgi:hypothetical protein